MKLSKAGVIPALSISVAALASTGWAQDAHEVYSLMPDTALSGLINPYMPDRSDIDKALPTEVRDPGDTLTIGWSEITLGNAWFVGVIDAAEATAAEYGNIEIDVLVADGDPSRTSAHFDTFIARGVDLIAVDPTDVAATAADIERAVAAGIPVIALGTVPDDSPAITTVLANPYGNGYEAGIYTAQQFGADTPMVAGAIIGTLGNSTSESRINGMISGIVFERSNQYGLGLSREDASLLGYNLFQELKQSGSFVWEEGNLELVGMGVGQWTEEGGLNAGEDLVTAHGERMNLILAENDFMGIGALTALENAGRTEQVRVACAADGFRVGIERVRDGEMLVTGVNSGLATGEGVVRLAHQIFFEGFDASNLPMGSYYPSEIITQENWQQWWDEDESNPFFLYTVPPFRTIDEIRAAAGVN
jgi:ribose transport system substrate-binding protein